MRPEGGAISVTLPSPPPLPPTSLFFVSLSLSIFFFFFFWGIRHDEPTRQKKGGRWEKEGKDSSNLWECCSMCDDDSGVVVDPCFGATEQKEMGEEKDRLTDRFVSSQSMETQGVSIDWDEYSQTLDMKIWTSLQVHSGFYCVLVEIPSRWPLRAQRRALQVSSLSS